MGKFNMFLTALVIMLVSSIMGICYGGYHNAVALVNCDQQEVRSDKARKQSHRAQVEANLVPIAKARLKMAYYWAELAGHKVQPIDGYDTKVFANILYDLEDRCEEWNVDPTTWKGYGFFVQDVFYNKDYTQITGVYVDSGRVIR